MVPCTRLRKRCALSCLTAAAALTLCVPATAQAQPAQPSAPTTKPQSAPKPGATPAATADSKAAAGVGPGGQPKADSTTVALPDDLRAGHFLIYVGGGFAFLPDAVVPQASPVFDVGLGGGAQLQLGVGLNRFLVLGLDGSFAYAGLGGDSCDGCDVMTIGTGLGLAFHPTQAFAFDPWVRYGVGYRHTIAQFEPLDVQNVAAPATSASEHAVDFAKISIGGDFFPDPLFGFGPYLETDLGLNRLDDTPQLYVNVQLGVRLSFDPMRAGTRITPGTLTASAY